GMIAGIGVVLTMASVSEASTIGLDVTSNIQLFGTGSFNNVGWQFQVNAPITINGLGVFDVNAAGLGESHQVGLWTNGGTLLASTTVTGGSPLLSAASTAGDWLFEDIAPILLMPGTYITGAFYSVSSPDQVIGSATIVTV